MDGIESTVSTRTTPLSYDATADRYTFLWQPDKSCSGRRQLVVKLTDGAKQRASFKVR